MQPLQDLSRSQRRNIEAGTTSRNQQQKQTGLSCEEVTQVSQRGGPRMKLILLQKLLNQKVEATA